MSSLNFTTALNLVLKTEGGVCNDPLDPGGLTDHGVTQAIYDGWRTSQGLPHQSVTLISSYEEAAIYRSEFWAPCHCDALPRGIDYATFDFAVNSGPHRATVCLQQAAGVPADGIIGPATLAALNAADPRRIINSLSAERLAYLQSLPGWAHDGNGWRNRVNSVEISARGMV